MLKWYSKNISAVQTFLLLIILVLQVFFLIFSLKLPRGLTISDIASIIQIILIIAGFGVAYYQIIFSRKIEERNRLWEKIHSLENEYIGSRVIMATKFIKFLDDNNKDEKELVEKYMMDIAQSNANFSVKLDQIFDGILYNTALIKKAYEKFQKKDSERFKKTMENFIIALTAKSKRDDLVTTELKEEARLITEKFREEISSNSNIFKSNDYKAFKEEIREILQ